MIISFNEFINEGKNIGMLYHFTSLSDAINIIDMDRMYSTQNTWGKVQNDNIYHRKYTGQISFTRNKFLFKDKPKGVSFGVRFVFDGDKLSNNYKISPVKFSTLWDEREESVFTIGSWNEREKLKKHQIFNFKKYIISVDLMPFDIYKQRIESYELDNYEKIGIDDIDDYTSNGKPKRVLIQKAKEWIESKGYNVRLVHESFNKKSYLSDRKL